MKRKHFIIFLLIMGVILSAIIFGIYSAMNIPAKEGTVTVSASGKTISPLVNTTEYKTRERTEKLRALKPDDIWKSLPQLDCTEGFTVNYSESTLENYHFSLYSPVGAPVYEDTPTFRIPEEKGEFIIKISFSWGTGDHSFISQECFFKGIYK